ncbi:hypothetical protein F0562_016706 [Nyssa sinensis]|uniref:Peptidase M41 FtsH extracellular domain-containing protein n=1 Tax=Nyssa sinensis TaxID=561372 RepID=A0A5J4ZCQ9_9ASTE|nr:hypothetical protein F0562_016706 [Nyssa sinensis]
MIFSRIGLSVSRSSRSTFQRNAIVRTSILNEAHCSWTNAGIAHVDGGLGLVRGYLTSIRAGRQIVSNIYLSELNSIFANPKVRRLFCSQVPKKRKFENYYPKDKKAIPKENNQKSQAKENSSKGVQGNFTKQYQNLVTPLLFISFVLSSIFLGPRQQKQISFQEFKNNLLEPGLVDRIVVANKSVAKVYVKSSLPITNQNNDEIIQGPINDTHARQNASQYKYYFNIGSVESFEEKLEEAQEALGIDPS